MRLSGSQVRALQQALVQTFPNYEALAGLVQHGLKENLAALTPQGDLAYVVFELIQWAERQGEIEDLLRAALHAYPTHPELRALAAALGVQPPPLAEGDRPADEIAPAPPEQRD